MQDQIWSYVYCDSCSPVVFCYVLFSAAINTNDVDYVTSRYPYKSCSRVFQSCLFHPANLVLHFPVLRFPPMHFGSVFSTPAFSTPAIWSHVFQSCVFHSRLFSRPFSTSNEIGKIYPILYLAICHVSASLNRIPKAFVVRTGRLKQLKEMANSEFRTE